jgi:hypothetical protein
MFEARTGEQIGAFASLSVVFLILTVTQFVLLWKYRSHKVVQLRGIPSLVIIAVGLILVQVAFVVFPLLDAPCALVSLFSILGIAMTVTFSFERCVLIVGQFKMVLEAQEIAKEMNGIQEEKPKKSKSWFIRNKNIFHHKLISRTKLWAAMFSLAFTVPILIAVFVVNPADCAVAPFYSENCQILMIDTFKGIALISILASLVGGTASKYLMEVEENFYVKQELFYQAIAGLCLGVYFCIYGFTPNFSESIKVPITITYLLVGGILSMVSFFVLIGFVLLKIRQEENVISKIRSTKLVAIEIEEAANLHDKMNILFENEQVLALFESFLCKEFAVENLLFWKAVQSLKQRNEAGLISEFDVVEEVIKIFRNFCASSGTLNVNISSQTKNLLTAVVQEAKESVQGDTVMVQKCLEAITKAQQEIYSLMSNDSLRRFLRSPEYQHYMAQNHPTSPSRHSRKSTTTPTHNHNPPRGSFGADNVTVGPRTASVDSPKTFSF